MPPRLITDRDVTERDLSVTRKELREILGAGVTAAALAADERLSVAGRLRILLEVCARRNRRALARWAADCAADQRCSSAEARDLIGLTVVALRAWAASPTASRAAVVCQLGARAERLRSRDGDDVLEVGVAMYAAQTVRSRAAAIRGAYEAAVCVLLTGRNCDWNDTEVKQIRTLAEVVDSACVQARS